MRSTKMLIRTKAIVILFGLFFLQSIAFSSSGTDMNNTSRRITIPLVEKGPSLKGDLSSPEWKKAAKVGDFIKLGKKTAAAVQTKVYVLYDPKNLYVAFVCDEPNTSKLVAGLGALWNDDCVELCLDPANGTSWMYHWIVNSTGGIWNGTNNVVVDGSYDFATNIQVKTSVGKNRWICEMKIPFKDLVAKPVAGEVWGINFCRERKVKHENSSWSFAAKSFGTAGKLGEAVFSATAETPVKVKVLSRGGGNANFNKKGRNLFHVNIDNTEKTSAKVKLLVESKGRIIGSKQAKIKAGQSKKLSVLYNVSSSKKAPKLRFSVTVNGRQQYSNVLKVPQDIGKEIKEKTNFWVVKDPLFKKLLAKKSRGPARECTLMWPYTLVNYKYNKLINAAKCFATRYVIEEAYRDYGKYGLITIGAHSINQKYSKKYNVNIMLYPGTKAPDAPWILDPRSLTHHKKGIKNRIKNPLNIWGVYAGDEVLARTLSTGVKLKANAITKAGDKYDYINKADEEVKRIYGDGKWGIPGNKRDWQPYNWIAYHKWVVDKFCGHYAQVSKIMKEHNPELKFVSDDLGGSSSYGLEYSRQAKYFDVFTFQWTPQEVYGKSWRYRLGRLGFLVKAIADVTGKDVWPCAHVESYHISPTPGDVVEMLSHIFRNGGTGFHFILTTCDQSSPRRSIDRDTRHTFFGSPRRYHTIMNIVDLARNMPKLKLPEYDRTGIFFNDDCLQAQYKISSSFIKRLEVCYTILGPVARSWFKFFDRAQALSIPSLNEKFDVIYLPTASYQQKEVVDKLQEFVEKGGTLICTDPQAFSKDIFGSNTSNARESIFGVQKEERLHAKTIYADISGKKFNNLPLCNGGWNWKLIPKKKIETLAFFDDGSPAIVSHKLGKGKAIFFGFIPNLKMLEDPEWHKFFKAWVSSFEAPVDLDIWRFQFPDSVIWKEEPKPGLCLTNNHTVWQEETPLFPQNVNVNGTYAYSVAPDAMPDEKTNNGDISFETGHLTDRRKSIKAKKIKASYNSPYKLPVERWMAGWSKTDPVAVTFDLQKVWKPIALKLWFTETMPGFTVEGSADGKAWRRLGDHVGLNAGKDVYDLKVPLSVKTNCQYVRVNFAERKKGKQLALVEAEIWGGKTGKKEVVDVVNEVK